MVRKTRTMTQKISTPVVEVVVQGHIGGGKRRRPQQQQQQQRIIIGPGPGQEEPVVVVQGDVEKKIRFDKRWFYRILILLFRRCCCCCRSSSSSSTSSNDDTRKFRLVYLLLLSFLLGILTPVLLLLQKLLTIYQAETHPSPFLSSKYNTLPSKMRGLAPPIELFDFPSPTERIQFYMGDWYYPINHNNTTTTINNNNNNYNNSNYNHNNETLEVCSTIKYWTPSFPIIGHPYIFDERNLQQMIYVDSWKRFRLPWRPQRSYPGDAYFYHFHLQSLHKNKNEQQEEEQEEEKNSNDKHINNNVNYNNNNINNNNNNNKKEKKQMILQFGDGKDSAKFLSTPYPIMVKTRLSQRVYEERYGGSSNSSKNVTTTGNNNNNSTRNSPPILGMYLIHRHYSDHFYEADAVWDTTPWNEKKSILIWRGSSSGQRRTVIEQYIDYNNNDTTIIPHDHQQQQQQQQQQSSIPIDVAFSEILKVHQNKFQHHPDEYYVRDAFSVSQLLQYKYLLVLEGWGLASNLKWMLYSNSLVFMAEPTKVSWAMEEKLVPWVHYIPLDENYTNLSEQLAWARTHDKECYQMVLYSRHYIERLVTSTQAQMETIEILQGIDQIYQYRYGPILQQCPHL